METIDDLIKELKSLRSCVGGDAKIRLDAWTSKRCNLRSLSDVDVYAEDNYWEQESYIKLRGVEY